MDFFLNSFIWQNLYVLRIHETSFDLWTATIIHYVSTNSGPPQAVIVFLIVVRIFANDSPRIFGFLTAIVRFFSVHKFIHSFITAKWRAIVQFVVVKYYVLYYRYWWYWVLSVWRLVYAVGLSAGDCLSVWLAVFGDPSICATSKTPVCLVFVLSAKTYILAFYFSNIHILSFCTLWASR